MESLYDTIPCRWYGVEREWAMPLSLNHLVKDLLVNWVPLSLVSFSGNPHLVKILVKHLITTLEVIVRMGKASGHLEAESMHVSIK